VCQRRVSVSLISPSACTGPCREGIAERGPRHISGTGSSGHPPRSIIMKLPVGCLSSLPSPPAASRRRRALPRRACRTRRRVLHPRRLEARAPAALVVAGSWTSKPWCAMPTTTRPIPAQESSGAERPERTVIRGPGKHQSAGAKCLIATTCSGRDARPSQALLPSSAGILDQPFSAR
jgi:hypothetical protein